MGSLGVSLGISRLHESEVITHSKWNATDIYRARCEQDPPFCILELELIFLVKAVKRKLVGIRDLDPAISLMLKLYRESVFHYERMILAGEI